MSKISDLTIFTDEFDIGEVVISTDKMAITTRAARKQLQARTAATIFQMMEAQAKQGINFLEMPIFEISDDTLSRLSKLGYQWEMIHTEVEDDISSETVIIYWNV